MRVFTAIVFTLCVIAPHAFADILAVYPDGSGDYPTIQYAIAQASWGDTVQLADGRFTGAGNHDLTYNGKPITIQSQSGNAEDCIIDCQASQDDPHRGFDFHWTESPNSILRGVTIANGYMHAADPYVPEICGGGIIIANGCHPTFIDVIVRDCTAPAGGGVFMYYDASYIGSSSSFTGCTFKDNTAWWGSGGGVDIYGGSPSFVDCVFERNTSNQGGCGIACAYVDPLTITGCWFRDNIGGNSGGIDVFSASLVEIDHTTFSGNSPGAVLAWGHYDEIHIRSCTFYDNTWCSIQIDGEHESVTVEETIIAFGNQGPAIYFGYLGGTVTLSCSNIYGNGGGDWTEDIADQFGVNGNISEDPLFCEPILPERHLQLQVESPCAPNSPPNPECGLLGAWPVGCDSIPPDSAACCVGDTCHVLTGPECFTIGGEWQSGVLTCTPNPCLHFAACCIDATCQVLTSTQCQDAGGTWMAAIPTCSPNPCVEYACCIEEECSVRLQADCVALGGAFLVGIESCDPDPCLLRACCLATDCRLLRVDDCTLAGGDWLEDITECSPNPCSAGYLLDGVFIVHAPPRLQWSSGVDFCQLYIDDYAISSSHEQVTRIDPDTTSGASSIWYVIAAWDRPREFCSVQFGLGAYDEDIFAFRDTGPCSGGGLEVPSNGWPGAYEGTLVVHQDHWSGNYVPVYWFAGYGYYEGRIPLSIDETQGFGGFTSCDGTPVSYDAMCFGALGVFTSGSACYHSGDLHACCVNDICSLISQVECGDLGGDWYPQCITCDPNPCLLTTVEEEALSPHRLYISPSTPNPFAHSSSIRYEVPDDSEDRFVKLRVFDPSGRLIRTLVSREKAPGQHAGVWNGVNDAGAPVPAGIYFYHLEWSGRSVTRRVLLVD
ncbi:right-handed parallel beta-helix repeat-containing protein [Candidatus Eisenbacteria bacterium]|uniref:Right-handed parallel beta-helix repeat-containing protein n=1 Tax=Eiseniibacteriota bacterium TaxID=2212470 RepID=A0ABV6YLV1_UNCEI